MGRVAILIDGGHYRKRSAYIWGKEESNYAAQSLIGYAMRHVKWSKNDLYRIFYYDCPAADFTVFNPVTKKNVPLKNQDIFKWQGAFLEELRNKRRVALRLGELSERQARYAFKEKAFKSICYGKKDVNSITDDDIELIIPQKGVDMKIAVDISSMAYKKQVDQIILITGDSDFVPASKLARREGIDFILDPMWAHIRPSLNEHVDGLHSCVEKPSDGRTIISPSGHSQKLHSINQ